MTLFYEDSLEWGHVSVSCTFGGCECVDSMADFYGGSLALQTHDGASHRRAV